MMTDEELDGRPRILGARFGVNPNSSSLGVDVTFLLLGGTATIAASLVLGALLRGRRWFEPRPEEPKPGAAGPSGPTSR